MKEFILLSGAYYSYSAFSSAAHEMKNPVMLVVRLIKENILAQYELDA
jgi:hypothetical protein